MDAPQSFRICATCIGFSSGLIGTCTSPARAVARGMRQDSSPFAAQVAILAPGMATRIDSHAASLPTRSLKSL